MVEKCQHSEYHLNEHIITARKRSLRRLCFYTCLSVILFTGWGLPGQVHPRAGTPPGRYTPLPGRYPPPLAPVNKRAVRIPLECILVLNQVKAHLRRAKAKSLPEMGS